MSEYTRKRLYAGAGMATLYKNGTQYKTVTVPMATAASSEAEAIGEMVKMSVERFPFADGYGNHGAVAVCIPDSIVTHAYQLITEEADNAAGS